MAIESETAAVPITGAPPENYVQWSAIFAGGAIAAALSVVFLSFGSAIGLSFVSPAGGGRLSASTMAAVAVFWALAQQIGAMIIGGYIAGRMRARIADVPRHEVEFRDGLHGAAVWALSVMVTTVIVASTVGSIARGGAEIAGRAASAMGSTSSTNVDPIQYYTDVLMRDTPASRPGQPAAAPAGQPAAAAEGDANRIQAQLTRILARSVASGSLSTSDREYAASVIARRTGLPQAEAERRLDQTFSQALDTVKQTAEQARRGAVLTGFVTAAGLILSLGAAWWAAMSGGHHRDNSVPASFTTAIRSRQAAVGR